MTYNVFSGTLNPIQLNLHKVSSLHQWYYIRVSSLHCLRDLGAIRLLDPDQDLGAIRLSDPDQDS